LLILALALPCFSQTPVPLTSITPATVLNNTDLIFGWQAGTGGSGVNLCVNGWCPVTYAGSLLKSTFGSGGGGGTGTVTFISVINANGFSGSISNPTTTPAITLQTTFTGLAYSNGTGLSAASVTGTGSVVQQTSPSILSANLNTPSAINLLNATNIQCASLPATTGNVTSPAGSCVNTIPAATITNAMHANSPAYTLKGNNTNTAGAPVDVTQAQLTEMLELPIVQVLKTMPSQTLFSYLVQLAGGSTPAEGVLTNDFPAASTTYLDYLCVLKGYHGTGLTFLFSWTSTVTTGNAQLQASIRRLQSGVTNITSAYTYTYQPMTATPPAASVGIPTSSIISFTDGTQMNGLQDGEFFILRLYRNAGSGSDTMGGDMQILGITGYAS